MTHPSSAENQRQKRASKILGITNPDKEVVNLLFTRGNDLELYNQLTELKRLRVFHNRLKTLCEPHALTPRDVLEIVSEHLKW